MNDFAARGPAIHVERSSYGKKFILPPNMIDLNSGMNLCTGFPYASDIKLTVRCAAKRLLTSFDDFASGFDIQPRRHKCDIR